MFNTLLRSAFIIVSLLMLLIPMPIVKADSIVAFSDPNLEAAIREAINKPSGDIYQSDLAGLRSLDASDRSITDLTGLEYCTACSGWNLVSTI